jgi:S1-C subfamily serine protease
MVPPTVGGTPTDVEAVGELLAGDGAADSPESQDPATLQNVATIEGQDAGALTLKWRLRPVEGGYSVGHWRITAGTYATAVYDRSAYPGVPSRYYVLSNNHVLANSNNARVGDPILQPGPYDGGIYPQDVIARLSRWVPIHFLPSTTRNYVDAAIAEGPFHLLDREIYWIGYVRGFRNNWPAINETLQKTGRTTNWTTGRVTAINATVNVGYGGGRVARFHGQIVTGRMGGPGDSGSLVLDLNENAIGLLFAGSATHTIINHIVFVQNLLGIRLGHF